MSPDKEGQIITFYSYKGGTGRTMAVANVAWILASNGKRVLVVDWDLESPGLHKFFHPFLDESTVMATPGVIEIINEYALAAVTPGSRPPDWHLDYARVLRHAVSLEWNEFPGNGTLDFLSAGRQNRDYASTLSSLDWDNFYDRLNGGAFFRAMRQDMKENYDYVLIDSRTGLSDVADICTVELPDTLVICFTMNDQGLDGGASVAQQINGRYRNRNIAVLPVPMRIEDAEKEKLDAGRALARLKFHGFPTNMNPEETSRYWRSVEVPYKPFYAFEETLAAFADEPGSPTSLLSAFERLTAAITGGTVTAMPPLPEDLRQSKREAFLRRQPSTDTEVLVRYSPEDRMWADWIEATLSRFGFRVLPRSTVMTAGPGGTEPTAPNARVIAVLSGAYVRSPQARSTWNEAGADPAGGPRQLIPVRVSEVRLSAPFTDRTALDLFQLGPEQACVALLDALDWPMHFARRPVHENEPRFPGTPPRIWNIPPRNADFTGRGDSLEGLRDKLVGGGKAVVLAQALYGLGGVGKTQIALEYAYRFMADYDLIWWVPAERADQILSSLAELASRLGIGVGDNIAEGAQAALEALRRGEAGGRWLLIFDNAEETKDLERYLPTGQGHVLITSRNQEWSHLAEPLEVDVFARNESVAHLRLHVPDLPEDAANRVAEVLGDLPLAIEQAGAWLEQTAMNPDEYVDELKKQAPRILAMSEVASYPASAVSVWNMSFDRLRERSPAAIRLLELCAFCSPGPISMQLLYSDEMVRSLMQFDESLREKLLLGRVIREISRLALIKVDQGNNSIQIHRLVQAVIRSQMSQDDQEAACHEVHQVLVGARPRQGDTDDPENWARYELIWPHLEPSHAEECREEETRNLLIDHVRFLWKRGEYDSGLLLARRLEALWAQDLGDDHRQTLHLRFHIANLLRSKGLLKEARDLDAFVLARQREILAADHPHTLMTAGSLAADLRGLGEFADALRLDQETYDRLRDLFGEDHPRTLAMANNLAVSLRLVGDCFAARRIDQDTLDRRRVVLGHDHPYTLFSETNLARDMREAGDFRESVDLLRRTLDRYQGVLGNDFPDTLRTAKSLAVSLRKSGAQAEALQLTQETYDRYLLHYGEDTPDVLSCALNLACDHSALNNKPQARDLAERVRSAYRQSLGADHPFTLVAANNLVTYLRGTDEPAAGRELAEKTLRMMTARLGEDHPFTLSCAINFANCLGDLGELAAAAELESQTLPKLAAKLGPLHPDTLVCEANLAVTLHLSGDEAHAAEIQQRVVEEMRVVLGERHPNADLLLRWQRNNRDLEPQPT
jgi:Tetratricopeptide repeat/TIR domain/AAA domain/NB-ARC domain